MWQRWKEVASIPFIPVCLRQMLRCARDAHLALENPAKTRKNSSKSHERGSFTRGPHTRNRDSPLREGMAIVHPTTHFFRPIHIRRWLWRRRCLWGILRERCMRFFYRWGGASVHGELFNDEGEVSVSWWEQRIPPKILRKLLVQNLSFSNLHVNGLGSVLYRPFLRQQLTDLVLWTQFIRKTCNMPSPIAHHSSVAPGRWGSNEDPFRVLFVVQWPHWVFLEWNPMPKCDFQWKIIGARTWQERRISCGILVGNTCQWEALLLLMFCTGWIRTPVAAWSRWSTSGRVPIVSMGHVPVRYVGISWMNGIIHLFNNFERNNIFSLAGLRSTFSTEVCLSRQIQWRPDDGWNMRNVHIIPFSSILKKQNLFQKRWGGKRNFPQAKQQVRLISLWNCVQIIFRPAWNNAILQI